MQKNDEANIFLKDNYFLFMSMYEIFYNFAKLINNNFHKSMKMSMIILRLYWNGTQKCEIER